MLIIFEVILFSLRVALLRLFGVGTCGPASLIWEQHHLWVLLSSRWFSYWAVMKLYDQVINRRRELMLMRSTLFLLCLWLIKQSPKGNTFSKWTKQREKLLPAEDLNYNCTSCCGAELNLHGTIQWYQCRSNYYSNIYLCICIYSYFYTCFFVSVNLGCRNKIP